MKKDKLVLALSFFLSGLMMSLFVKPWFFGLPLMAVALFYLTEGLEKPDKSSQATKDKGKTDQ